MENELRSHLLTCAALFAKARERELTTVGRLAANDGSFFERIRDPKNGFTARTYDRVMEYLSANWPDDVQWPRDIPRPGSGQSPSPGPGSAGAPASAEPAGAEA